MKTAFITGASSGIGKAAAQLFLSKGWNVAAAVRNPEEETELLSGTALRLFACDVTDAESVRRAMQEALETFGGIDVLVNNAGVYLTQPLEALADSDIALILDTNIKGAMHCIQAVLPHFRQKGDGVVVNVSSVAGFAAFPFQTLYHASKWGLEGLSESLQYELKEFNIKVKVVEPGVVKTNLYDRMPDASSHVPQAYSRNFSIWRKHLDGNIRKGVMPEVSARSIYQAASDNKWKMRYASGADTKTAAVLRFLLPLPAFRFVVEKMTGVR